jgi:hypothetical protein
VLDELAYWRSEDAKNPDQEVYQALTPGLATLPDSMLIAISSPYRRAGLLYRKWREHFGKDDDDVLVIHATTRQLNPTIKQKVVDDALEADAPAARAEWLAEWRDDLSAYVDRATIEAAVEIGLLVRPPLSRLGYVAFVDPSGGSSDSMTLSVAHKEGDRVVLDLTIEKKPPFSPDQVTREMASVLKGYRCGRVTGDRYAGEWPREAFRKQGIVYEPSDRNKSELFIDCLPLFMSGRVSLIDNPRLVSQFAGLERRVGRSGRDSVDHAPGAKDDVANSAAGALVLATSKSPMRISARAVELAGLPRGAPLVDFDGRTFRVGW